ncbi:venom serine protease Bi-VSP-like [Homarus americanus]|uniref:venom serine protease Bi-VSP-like n=1 Tax=Homarus americanus TaxID=6706 RepID=UPI001C463631|nr:venom serine protease Bi-VSP-like [Homarus americanus]
MQERLFVPGGGGVLIWAVVVMGAVSVWAESYGGMGVRLPQPLNDTVPMPVKAAGVDGRTASRDFGVITKLGEDFLRCSDRRRVEGESRKTSNKRLNTSPCGRTTTYTIVSPRTTTVGECGLSYEMGKGDAVKFILPRFTTSCEMVFKAKEGYKLSFTCSKFRASSCRNEYLFITDGVNPPMTFCGRKRKPTEATDLSQLYIKYERRREQRRKSRMHCTISATGSDDGGPTGTTSAEGSQIPNCSSMCGAAPSGAGATRIVGGSEADKGEYPWMVMLTIDDGGPLKGCGGAIISKRHVLTAAHCVNFRNLKLTATVGLHDMKNLNTGVSKVFKVVDFIAHPDFNSDTLANDIAVLTLEGDVNWSRRVGAVCLSPEKDYEGQMGVVSGWGTLSFQGSQPSKLQEVGVQVTNQAKCVKNYLESDIDVLDTNVCAASPGKDACQGDSGGPLVILNNGIWYQMGVVSYGVGCARPDYPGVYTRVSSYVPWILDQVSSSC